MRGPIVTVAQIKTALHEGRITKRIAEQSLPIMTPRRYTGREPITSMMPRQCDCCGQSFWQDTLIPISLHGLICSGCYTSALS
ncbi:hypothetical protein [Ktedonospora formicarum]|uniref:Uncharacterized protein n=1 Tax=Ktedonospora formicarum TaxID=2778364 RepID=A0A8J3HW40_9CHLR|nr:hypothetical protein [Ktedonospora formicarum]GHO45167.1 hypothetical protein KSX_33300 [Ktedonospora formicarum]